jgi:hypothetical protein
MNTLLEKYQRICPYQIIESCQSLNFEVDIELLKQELFNFITDNKFGFNAVSLRLPEGKTNYIDFNERLESTAVSAYEYLIESNQSISPENVTHDDKYLEWHPTLKNSYVKKIVPKLEEYCGFKIGRVRLGWLKPGKGYPMHVDAEPLRIHIPLVTNLNSYIISEQKLYHMEYGKIYHLITAGMHTAYNFGKLPRLHLIFSTYSDNIDINQELYKLYNSETLNENFINHAGNCLDNTSISFLSKLFLSAANSQKEKNQILFEIKKLSDLSKNLK